MRGLFRQSYSQLLAIIASRGRKGSESGGLAALAQEDRGRLLQDPSPRRDLLGLFFGGVLDHAADAALGDLEAMALGDLVEAVVVLGEGGGDGFETVFGDPQAARVVH